MARTGQRDFTCHVPGNVRILRSPSLFHDSSFGAGLPNVWANALQVGLPDIWRLIALVRSRDDLAEVGAQWGDAEGSR
jgi:hypothetical protein